MWNKCKAFVACVLGYVVLTNLFAAFKQVNLVSSLTVPGIGMLSGISRSLVFQLSDKLGDYLFYTITAFLTAMFLFIPMLIYGFQPNRKWIILQIIILIANTLLFFFTPLHL